MLTTIDFKNRGFLGGNLTTHNKKSYVNKKTGQVIIYTFKKDEFFSHIKDAGNLEINGVLFKDIFNFSDLDFILKHFVSIIKEPEFSTKELNYVVKLNEKDENIISRKDF